jgi:hypothetical protein
MESSEHSKLQQKPVSPYPKLSVKAADALVVGGEDVDVDAAHFVNFAGAENVPDLWNGKQN